MRRLVATVNWKWSVYSSNIFILTREPHQEADNSELRKNMYPRRRHVDGGGWVAEQFEQKKGLNFILDTFCKKRDRPCYIFLTFKGKKQQKPHSEKDCSGCSELWAILIALGSQAQVQKWNIRCPGSQCRTSGSKTRVDCRDGIPHRLSWSEQKMLKTKAK